jgi:hypothetical protein
MRLGVFWRVLACFGVLKWRVLACQVACFGVKRGVQW